MPPRPYKEQRMTGKVNIAVMPEKLVGIILWAKDQGFPDKSKAFRDAFDEFMAAHEIKPASRADVIKVLGQTWARKNKYKLEGGNS